MINSHLKNNIINKKILNFITQIYKGTYIIDKNKIIAYNKIRKENKFQYFIYNLNPYNNKSDYIKNDFLNNGNSHLDYLFNNIKNINLNKNTLGKKSGILITYNKIISYNYNPSKSVSKINSLGIINKVLINNTDFYNINKILISFFKSIYCIISKPIFIHTTDKVIIQIFYYLTIPKKKIFRIFTKLFKKGNFNRKISYISYKNSKRISRLRRKSTLKRIKLFKLRKFSIIKVYRNKFKLLCNLLSKQFNKSVELQLIRLHNPIYDSNILVNLLSINIRNKNKNNRKAVQNIYNKKLVKNINDYKYNKSVKYIPNYLSGLNIKIAGRLMREPVIPRLTTKVNIKGASSPGKVTFLDIATITKKNRKGAYTITIKSGQNFFNKIKFKKYIKKNIFT